MLRRRPRQTSSADVLAIGSTGSRRRPGRPAIADSIELVMLHSSRSEAWWPGEKRLMLALLTDAIDLLAKGPGVAGSPRRRLFEETSEWFACDDTAWPCSFVRVCEALGLDANAVRRAVSRQRRACEDRPSPLRSTDRVLLKLPLEGLPADSEHASGECFVPAHGLQHAQDVAALRRLEGDEL